MKPTVLLPIAVAGILLLPSRAVWARDCGRTSHGHYPTSGSQSSEPTNKPVDAQPWVELLEEEAERLVEDELACVLARVDGQAEIPASIEVAPADRETFRSGCTTVGVFASQLGRVIPAEALEPNTTYRIACDGDFAFEDDEFQTGDRMASPPPTLVVDRVGVEDFCDRERVMALDISGLGSAFWEEGGIITAEYEDGSVDWVGSAFSDPASVVLARPAEGEEVVVLTVVNGAGVAGPPLELDVSDIAGPRAAEGCATGPHPRASLLWLLASLLLLRGRSSAHRRSVRVPGPRRRQGAGSRSS